MHVCSYKYFLGGKGTLVWYIFVQRGERGCPNVYWLRGKGGQSLILLDWIVGSKLIAFYQEFHLQTAVFTYLGILWQHSLNTLCIHTVIMKLNERTASNTYEIDCISVYLSDTNNTCVKCIAFFCCQPKSPSNIIKSKSFNLHSIGIAWMMIVEEIKASDILQ